MALVAIAAASGAVHPYRGLPPHSRSERPGSSPSAFVSQQTKHTHPAFSSNRAKFHDVQTSIYSPPPCPKCSLAFFRRLGNTNSKKIWTTLAFFIFFRLWILDSGIPLSPSRSDPDSSSFALYTMGPAHSLYRTIYFFLRRSSVCPGPNPATILTTLFPPPTPHSLSFPMHRHDPCLIPLPYPTIILPLPFPPRLGRVHRANHVSPFCSSWLIPLSFALLI
jgi:hypothetical protein